MKKLWNIIALLVLSATIAGCGGAAAPPIDLPAPVTGQIDISAPDAEGKSTVTGHAGAVPGGSYVMVINESLEVTQNTSPLIKLMDALVPSAHAAGALPDVCNEPGHWCVIAEEDGSFVLTIDAYINDSIIIVIINAWGDEISERLVRQVPASDFDIVACPDKGVNGKLVTLANPGGIYVGLYEGSADASNVIVMVDAVTGETTSIPLPGCFAHGFTILPSGNESGRAVMISSDDKLMWVGYWSGERIVYAQTFQLDDAPIGIANIGESDHVAVTFKKTGNLAVGIVSANDGSANPSVNIPNPTSGQLTKLVAMRAIGPFADGAFLIGLLSQTDALSSYVSLLDSTDLTNFTPGNLFLVAPGYDFTDLSDMEFALDTINLVYMLIVNHGEKAVHVRDFAFAGQVLGLSLGLNTVNTLTFSSSPNVKDIPNNDYAPQRLAVNYTTANIAQAFAITGTDYVWKIFDFLTSTAPSDSFINVSGASTATDIATNLDDNSVIIGNGVFEDITGEVN